jgi:hypothetical protein
MRLDNFGFIHITNRTQPAHPCKPELQPNPAQESS